MRGGCRESEERHIAVNALELPGVDHISLVPDSHASVRTDALVEVLPNLQMRLGGMAGEILQVLKTAPVLDGQNFAPAYPGVDTQKSLGGILLQ